jgi:nucleoid-associated protein YgaU
MTAAPFPPTSRYAAVEVVVLTESDGREIAHLRRRFCPNPDQLVAVASYTVTQDDRLDRVAAQTIGDPLQFWQIADANRAIRPADLTERIGRRLRITLPAGFGGGSGA